MFFFSLLQGILAFFAPCAVALLPGYLSALLTRDGTPKNMLRHTLALASLTMIGIALVYIIGGVLLLTIAQLFKQYIPWVVIAMGALIIVMGGFMLAGRSVALPIHGPQAQSKNTYIEAFIFGIAYGLGALGCLFPFFLIVVTTAIADGLIGLTYILAYIIGMASFMLLFYLLAVYAKEFLKTQVRRLMPYITRISGFVIILAGIYIIYYQSALV